MCCVCAPVVLAQRRWHIPALSHQHLNEWAPVRARTAQCGRPHPAAATIARPTAHCHSLSSPYTFHHGQATRPGVAALSSGVPWASHFHTPEGQLEFDALGGTTPDMVVVWAVAWHSLFSEAAALPSQTHMTGVGGPVCKLKPIGIALSASKRSIALDCFSSIRAFNTTGQWPDAFSICSVLVLATKDSYCLAAGAAKPVLPPTATRPPLASTPLPRRHHQSEHWGGAWHVLA